MTTLSRASPRFPEMKPELEHQSPRLKAFLAYSQSHQNDMVLRLVRESDCGSNALSQPTNSSAIRVTLVSGGAIA